MKSSLIALLLLCTPLTLAGCARQRLIVDDRIPHQLAEDAEVKIYVRAQDGRYIAQYVTVPAGSWVASDHVVRGER